MNVTTLDAMTERLNRLEREIRWWRRMAVLALIGVSAIGLMGQARTRVVEADAFVLRGANSSPRARLHTQPNGAVAFAVYDQAGKRRTVLGVSPDGAPSLLLLDTQETGRAGLVAAGDGSVVLTLGRNRIALNTLADGSSTLLITDKNQSPRAEMGVDPDGSPVLRLWSARALAARVTDQNIVLYGADEKPRVMAAVRRDGSGAVYVFDKDGKLIWKAP